MNNFRWRIRKTGAGAVDRKRAAILQAARMEFAEHGHAAAAITAIARRARVSSRTIYTLFASKQGLLDAMLQDSAVEFIARLDADEAVADAPTTSFLRGAQIVAGLLAAPGTAGLAGLYASEVQTLAPRTRSTISAAFAAVTKHMQDDLIAIVDRPAPDAPARITRLLGELAQTLLIGPLMGAPALAEPQVVAAAATAHALDGLTAS